MIKLLGVLVFLFLFFIPVNAEIGSISFTVPDDKIDHATTGFLAGRILTKGFGFSNSDSFLIMTFIATAKELDDNKGDINDIFATILGTFVAIDFTF